MLIENWKEQLELLKRKCEKWEKIDKTNLILLVFSLLLNYKNFII